MSVIILCVEHGVACFPVWGQIRESSPTSLQLAHPPTHTYTQSIIYEVRGLKIEANMCPFTSEFLTSDKNSLAKYCLTPSYNL